MRTDRFLYLVLTVVLIGLLYNLNTWEITEGREAVLAEISREMLRTGDYLHPRLLAIDTYEHPPLAYWLMSLGMRLWGVNSFGVRFFSQIAVIVQAILVYHIALRLLGVQRMALFAGLIYPALPLVLWGSRQLSIESFLATFELGALGSLLVYYLERQPLALYSLTICLGLGVLTDGLRVFLLPLLMGLCILISSLIFGQLQLKWHYRHGMFALFWGLLIGGYWYLYIAWGAAGGTVGEQANWGDYFWKTYGVDKFLAHEGLTHLWWHTPLALAVGSLPWFWLFVISLGGILWRNRITTQLTIFWLFLPFVFLTLTHPDSVLSLLSVASGLSVVLGYVTHELLGQEVRRYSLFFLQVYLVVGLLTFAVPLFSQLLGERIQLTWAMGISAIAILLTTLALFRLIQAGVRFRLVAMSLVPALLLVLYSGYFVAANPPASTHSQLLAQFIQKKQLQDLPILVYNEALPALAFNLDRDIITINDGQVTPDVRFQTRNRWRQQWLQPNQPSSARRLRRLISSPSVLIVAGNLPDRWNWIQLSYPQTESIGRWQILYRAPA